MTFLQVSPQTAGCLGDKTKIEDISARPVKFSNFQFEFTIWPDDDLIQATIQGYAGTHRLAEAIKTKGLTGIVFDKLEMIDGDQFYKCRKDHQGQELTEFLWFKFVGVPGKDDFGLIPAAVTFPWSSRKKLLI